MAEQILKDPYNFDFLTVTATAKEREIERGLLTHLRDLLLELGRGFSFVGSQMPVACRIIWHTSERTIWRTGRESVVRQAHSSWNCRL
jgi:predicted nuclease of restriction endonuclease-like (RecB) superfamily